MHAEQMTKLVGVAHGSARGVYVDVRNGSPTFGLVDEVDLELGVQVLVPSSMANGFQALAPPRNTPIASTTSGHRACPVRRSLPSIRSSLTGATAIDPDDVAQISAKDRSALTFAQLSQGIQS